MFAIYPPPPNTERSYLHNYNLPPSPTQNAHICTTTILLIDPKTGHMPLSFYKKKLYHCQKNKRQNSFCNIFWIYNIIIYQLSSES